MQKSRTRNHGEGSTNLWFDHPQFQNYCDYYNQMHQWYKRYTENFTNFAQQTSHHVQHLQNGLSPNYYSQQFARPSPTCELNPNAMWQWRNPESEQMSTCNEVSNSEEDDDESFVMEITDELLAFLETSEKHRQELRMKRAEEENKIPKHSFVGKYTTVRNAYTGCLQESCLPPRERPGVKRTAEMKLLYGKDAAMIHGMETAMQLTFDHNCDLHQPKLWPNIPLKM